MPPPEPSEVVVRDATAWRRWLERHHADPVGAWLVLARKGTSEPTTLTYAAALEEALCFGWIDGQVRRRDDATYSQRFTPRRARSRWSQRNVEHVGRLLGEGRMHAAGVAEMERAQADGRWAAAYPGMARAEVPADLAVALTGSPRAAAAFATLGAQNRYALLFRLGAIRGDRRLLAPSGSPSLWQCWSGARPSTRKLAGLRRPRSSAPPRQRRHQRRDSTPSIASPATTVSSQSHQRTLIAAEAHRFPDVAADDITRNVRQVRCCTDQAWRR